MKVLFFMSHTRAIVRHVIDDKLSYTPYIANLPVQGFNMFVLIGVRAQKL